MEKLNVLLCMFAFTLVFAIVFMFKRGKLREKFYQAVICGDYNVLLYFLILDLKNDSIRKKVLNKCYYCYKDYLRQGLNRYFDSHLNVTVTGSRISIIEEFFKHAKQEFSKSESEISVSSGHFWEPIESELKRVIFICGPNYFCKCYVNSLLDSEKEEEDARSFLLDYYNKCANSHDEHVRSQFYSFVELVNKEIDQDQEYLSIPKEKKDFLRTKKLKIEENISTVRNVYAHA